MHKGLGGVLGAAAPGRSARGLHFSPRAIE